MTIGREKAPGRYEVKLFGGLNDYDRKIVIGDRRWATLTNASLRRIPSIVARGGTSEYDDRSAGITNSVKALHRYKKRDGTSQILMWHKGNAVLADGAVSDDDGAFSTTIESGVTTDDGFVRFVQWGDCALFVTENNPLRSYNDGESPEDIQPQMVWNNSALNAAITLAEDTSGNGNIAQSKIHHYRFTADVYHGDVFLGETFPLCNNINYRVGNADTSGTINVTSQISGETPSHSNEYTFMQETISVSASAVRVDFKRFAAGLTSLLPPGAKFLNVYKKGVPPSSGGSAGSNHEVDYDYWFIGSIEISVADSVTQNGGTSSITDGDSIFIDDGLVPLGRQISYRGFLPMPKSRFIERHKNLLWMGYPDIYRRAEASGALEFQTYPDRLYFSLRGAPANIPVDNFLKIGDSGEGITGVKSFANRMLMVFTPNSVTAVLGGDDEFAPGIPLFYTDIVSESIGCIAPETITWVDGGMAWLSERGPVVFDGQRVRPLGDFHGPKALIDAIPKARRYHAIGFFDRKEGAYGIAHTYDDGDSGASTANRYISLYSFVTDTWTREKHPKGFGAAVTVADTDQDNYVLLGREDSVLTNFSTVVKRDDANSDPMASGSTQGISIDWESGFIDCGVPDEDKQFLGMLVHYRSPVAITVDVETKSVVTADATVHGIDTEDVGQASFSIPISQSASNEDDIYYMSFDARVWGKLIKLHITASTTGVPIEIHKIELLFYPQGTRIG